MKYMKKLLIVLLLFMMVTINVKAWTVPSEYNEPIVELRGAWVSTVSNIDISRQTSIEQYKTQYTAILDNFERFNMNAVFFQVRPTNDAFYESEINPWSVYLIGKQGKDPGWDPLPWLVEETHKRGMEFHAWLNPYRASLDVFTSSGLLLSDYERQLNAALANMDDKNFAKKNPDLLIQGGLRILLNPAEEKVRQHIYDTILEIVTKYDVDAIHFDDYFYTDVSLTNDKEQFLAMNGNPTYNVADHKDWRRLQVDTLIEGIHDRLVDFNSENNRKVQFGISPAAGWAPSAATCTPFPNGYGMEGGMEGYPCSGYSSYHDLYADTRKWVKEEWLDYILPQNYFELGRYHEEITDWWSRQVEGTSVNLYMGIGLYQYGHYNYLTENEYVNQIKFNHQYKNVKGVVVFSYKSFLNTGNPTWLAGVQNLEALWSRTPLLPYGLTNSSEETQVASADLVRKNNLVEINFASSDKAHGYAIYRFANNVTPNFSEENIYKLVNNTTSNINFIDKVNNSNTFDYYIKAVLKDGSLSQAHLLKEMDEAFVNTQPTIEITLSTQSRILIVRNKFNIEVEVNDLNNDQLVVTFAYSTDGTRYRYDELLKIIDGKSTFEFTIPDILTETARIRIGVEDGSDPVYVYSHLFEVTKGMGLMQSQLYYFKKQIDNTIKSIIG